MTINQDNQEPNLADLADGTLSGPASDAWLAAHPQQAAEVRVAQQMRSLLQQLRNESVEIPANLEVRILANIHRSSALRELLNLNLSGASRALIELLTVLFSLFPSAASTDQVPRSSDGLSVSS